jgi:hypothetical protein
MVGMNPPVAIGICGPSILFILTTAHCSVLMICLTPNILRSIQCLLQLINLNLPPRTPILSQR